jgi:hypothetical protein
MNRFARLALRTVLVLALAVGTALAAEIPRMSVDDLAGRLGDPQLSVIDARSTRDWDSAELIVRGAQRRYPGTVAAWAGEYRRDQTIVLYCS